MKCVLCGLCHAPVCNTPVFIFGMPEAPVSHLHSMMREVLASAFKDMTLPGSVEPPPSVNTMDHLMGKLQSSLMGKHPLLVEKVSSMAKHLERVLQEKVSPDTLKGTLEGVETGEEEGDPLYMYIPHSPSLLVST